VYIIYTNIYLLEYWYWRSIHQLIIEFIIQLSQNYRLKLHYMITFKLLKKFLTFVEGKDNLRMFL